MSLGSPTHAIIGAAAPDRMADHLSRFGFTIRREGILPAVCAMALYGLDRDVREIRLEAPGSKVGWLRIVESTLDGVAPLPYSHGPALIDLYTRDISQSMQLATESRAHPGPTVSYPVAGLGNVYEARATGPDYLSLGFVMSEERRGSLLDRNPTALHSELHAYVWTVASIDAALPFWRDEAGMNQLLDSHVDDPGISEFMELPRKHVRIRIVHFADADANPVRFELMEFPDDAGKQTVTLPLRPGLNAPAFHVADLGAAQTALPSVRFRPVVNVNTELHRNAMAVSGLAPGGVQFELWQETALGR